ncbi:MAG: hypothetical protein JNL74_13425 [Fibrobacteres bacterium]|nr:hypothetical protein [Fibrobacterota bacterium]
MKKQFSFIFVAVLSFVLLAVLSGCTTKEESVAKPTGVLDEVDYYAISGDTLFVYTPAGMVDNWSYCNGSTLSQNSDTSEADTMPMLFTQTGNTLILLTGEEDDTLGNSWGFYMIFTRQDKSTGINGYWKLTGSDVKVTDGVLSDSLLNLLKIESQEAMLEDGILELVFSNNQISVYQIDFNNFADRFIDDWNDDAEFQVDRCAITVNKVNASTVRMVGDSTSEIVTLTATATYGDVTYSSNVTGHAITTVYENPTSCPNSVPSWYYDFIEKNMKKGTSFSLAKKFVSDSNKKRSSLSTFAKKLNNAVIGY